MGKKSNLIKAHEVTIMIRKDMTTHLPLTCPLYEKALVEVAHPEATVDVIKDNGIKEYDMETERERMVLKYGHNPDTDESLMEQVFGHGGRDIARVNSDLEDDLNIEGLSEVQDLVEVDTMTMADLKKELDSLGIEYPAQAQKDRLKSLLRSARSEEPEEQAVA